MVEKTKRAILKRSVTLGLPFSVHLAAHFSFASHGRALTGESSEHALVVGRIQSKPRAYRGYARRESSVSIEFAECLR